MTEAVLSETGSAGEQPDTWHKGVAAKVKPLGVLPPNVARVKTLSKAFDAIELQDGITGAVCPRAADKFELRRLLLVDRAIFQEVKRRGEPLAVGNALDAVSPLQIAAICHDMFDDLKLDINPRLKADWTRNKVRNAMFMSVAGEGTIGFFHEVQIGDDTGRNAGALHTHERHALLEAVGRFPTYFLSGDEASDIMRSLEAIAVNHVNEIFRAGLNENLLMGPTMLTADESGQGILRPGLMHGMPAIPPGQSWIRSLTCYFVHQ